jgi:hypothetical protein
MERVTTAAGHRDRLAWAARCTAEFREGASLRWRNLADRLSKEGVAPDDAAISDFGPDGGGLATGLVVTRKGRVFEFTLALGGAEQTDFTGSLDDGYVFDWTELDGGDLEGIYLDAFDIGREILGTAE